MNRIALSKFVGGWAAAALLCAAAMPQAQAVTLDKLVGMSLTVGNLVFTKFAAPSFVGAGPGNIDVQAISMTDPDTGKQQSGLRFFAPFSQSPNAGPHEIVLNVQYVVTHSAGQLSTIAQSMNATARGHAADYLFTRASPAPGFVADATLTYIDTCIAGGTFDCENTPASAPLFSGNSTFYVEHQVQLLISNHTGVPGGTTTLQEFDVLYGE